MIAAHFNIVNVDDFCVLVLDEVEQGPRLARAVVGVPSKAMVMTHDLNLFTLVMLLIMVIMDDGDVHDEGDEGDDIYIMMSVCLSEKSSLLGFSWFLVGFHGF